MLRDLFVAVINKATTGRRAAATVFQNKVQADVPFQAHGTVPSAHSPKLLIHRNSSYHSMAVSLYLLASRGIKQWITFFTRLAFLLLGENTWENQAARL